MLSKLKRHIQMELNRQQPRLTSVCLQSTGVKGRVAGSSAIHSSRTNYQKWNNWPQSFDHRVSPTCAPLFSTPLDLNPRTEWPRPYTLYITLKITSRNDVWPKSSNRSTHPTVKKRDKKSLKKRERRDFWLIEKSCQTSYPLRNYGKNVTMQFIPTCPCFWALFLISKNCWIKCRNSTGVGRDFSTIFTTWTAEAEYFELSEMIAQLSNTHHN